MEWKMQRKQQERRTEKRERNKRRQNKIGKWQWRIEGRNAESERERELAEFYGNKSMTFSNYS